MGMTQLVQESQAYLARLLDTKFDLANVLVKFPQSWHFTF